MSKILFVIPPLVHLLDINGPAHIFYEAKEFGQTFDIHFITLNQQDEIKSSAGLFFSKLESFQDFQLQKGDYIFIPGIKFEKLTDQNFIKKCQPFFAWLNQQHLQEANICSVCTGTFLLAESGILNDKICTTHWRYLTKFKEKFPQIELETNRLFVAHDKIFTSAGVSSGIDLALYLLEKHYDASLAASVAKEVVVHLRRTDSDPQLNIYLQYRNHLDNRIHTVQDFLIKNISTSLTLIDIAQQVNMSPRNLTRLFKSKTQITVGEYLEKLRVEKAVQLLSEGNKVQSTANACGLKSTNQLRSLLKKHKGVLPSSFSIDSNL